ncbi:MAG: ATP synthase subunit I [Actinomycetota bacterium]
MTALEQRLDGPSPAFAVARDMVSKGVVVLPFALMIGALIGGFGGAASVGYGMVLVLVNFLLAAYLLAWASKISFALVATFALGGYILRLGLIFLAVWLVKDAWWVQLVPLGITIIVTHLGLLMWELRFVAASLAHPGLKPSSGGSRPAAGYR